LDFTDISLLYGSFLCVVFALLTATGDAIPLPVRWPYLLYCLDDRALRRHTILSLYTIFKASFERSSKASSSSRTSPRASPKASLANLNP
jgi:hypothetical protein